MPHIRFYGARSPSGTARQLVQFQDPDAACSRGLLAVIAAARRHAQSQNLQSDAESRAIDEYVENTGYEGLQYVGGVCFVEDGTFLRGCDEQVTEDVYRVEFAAIVEANKTWRQQRERLIEAENDLWRMPSSEQQTLRWRTRCEIVSHAELQHHVAYPLGKFGYACMRHRSPVLPDGRIQNIVDVYHDEEAPIEVAILFGREAAELFADLLAIAAYGPASVTRVFAISPPFCRVGVDFKIATFSGNSYNSPVPVAPATFAGFTEANQRSALRNVRAGLSSPLPSESFVSFYNAAEVLADQFAREGNWRRNASCATCGHERPIGWDLKRGFQQFYLDARVMGDPFEAHRNLRGKIQHGAVKGAIAEQRQIQLSVGAMRATAVVAVAKKFGVAPQVATYLSPEQWPVCVWSCKVDYSGFRSTLARSQHVFFDGGLPQSACGEGGRTVAISTPDLEQPLDQRLFPAVLFDK